MRDRLIADLRNKFSPIKAYLEAQRQLEATSEGKTFIDGYNRGGLEAKIPKLKMEAEKAMSQVEYIIDQLSIIS